MQIGVAKYQTSVALPSYAEDRQYIVRAYASVAPHVPKQVLLLQPGGQLHTTAGDAMPIPPVYAKSTTHPNGDTAGSYVSLISSIILHAARIFLDASMHLMPCGGDMCVH